jgi:hypothetical protein
MRSDEEDKPPIFKSWKGLYIFVIAHLLLLVAVFYILTKAFE